VKIYDTIVIGAGPAGAAAAYFLARAGKCVLILEKRSFPRPKSCAGGLPRKAAGIFDFDLAPCLEVAVKGAVFSWLSSERRYEGGDEVMGWVTRREVFDDFLVRKAVEAGAELRESTEAIGLIQDRERAIVYTARESLVARSVVGADGAHSRIARMLSLKTFKRVGFGLEARLNVSERVLKDYGSYLYFDFGGVPRGYAWIFPRRDHLSAGVASYLPSHFFLQSDLKNFLEREGLGGDYAGARVTGAPISFSVWPGGWVRGRCLLAGDAAGLTDRMTGEGLYQAMTSGKLAARAIERFLAGERPLRDYSRMVRRVLWEHLFWAWSFSLLITWFPRWAFREVMSNPRRARKGMLVAMGEMSYRQVLFGQRRDATGAGS
jgi:geranylgeranyl reductase family protein